MTNPRGYYWEVMYQNGLKDISVDTAYSDIVRDRVKRLSLLKDGNLIYSLPVEPEDNFLYRKRTTMSSDGTSSTCHILARLSKHNNKIIFAFENGDIITRTDFDDNDQWFYSPTIREEEKI